MIVPYSEMQQLFFFVLFFNKTLVVSIDQMMYFIMGFLLRLEQLEIQDITV